MRMPTKEAGFIEGPLEDEDVDPDAEPIVERRLVTQPFDIAISALFEQIEEGTLHSARPSFQRKYVWNDRLASKLVESILLSVPVPPCYLSQNDDYELDVIDGQQRIFSLYRYLDNQFALRDLDVLSELNRKRFHQLPDSSKRKIKTYSLRCVIVTNESSPDIKFDVFERLNSNTVPLNSQELRNCIYRGDLIELVNELATNQIWLGILGRKSPDNRMRTEELVLRYFSFLLNGFASYKAPLKRWLNHVARDNRKLSEDQRARLPQAWETALINSVGVLEPSECFRRPEYDSGRTPPVNRALMDLMLVSMSQPGIEWTSESRKSFRHAYSRLLKNEEFLDLISRSIDHTSRMARRVELWNEIVGEAVPNATVH